jgi:predicted RNA-binding protein with EMAP domain
MTSYLEIHDKSIPTIRSALKLYSNRIIEVIEDEELKGGNELIKDDLLDGLKNIQYILSNLSYSFEGEKYKKSRQFLFDIRNTITTVLEVYKRDLEKSKGIVESRLEETYLGFKNVETEIEKVGAAVEYVKTQRPDWV